MRSRAAKNKQKYEIDITPEKFTEEIALMMHQATNRNTNTFGELKRGKVGKKNKGHEKIKEGAVDLKKKITAKSLVEEAFRDTDCEAISDDDFMEQFAIAFNELAENNGPPIDDPHGEPGRFTNEIIPRLRKTGENVLYEEIIDYINRSKDDENFIGNFGKHTKKDNITQEDIDKDMLDLLEHFGKIMEEDNVVKPESDAPVIPENFHGFGTNDIYEYDMDDVFIEGMPYRNKRGPPQKGNEVRDEKVDEFPLWGAGAPPVYRQKFKVTSDMITDDEMEKFANVMKKRLDSYIEGDEDKEPAKVPKGRRFGKKYKFDMDDFSKPKKDN